MSTLIYSLRKLIYSVPLIFGVTLISFLLMVKYGPDMTYMYLSKNPTKEEIKEIKHQLGYDRSTIVRYGIFLKELFTFNFGNSYSTGEKVSSILKKAVPISILVAIPGIILGNLFGIILALIAAYYRSRWPDKFIMVFAVIGMSISYLSVVIGFQILFCSFDGLNLFPVQGWEVA